MLIKNSIFIAILVLGLAGCGLGGSGTEEKTITSPVLPDPASTIRPTSGIWSFTMGGNTGDLSGGGCPTTPGGFSSGGNATLNVTQDGLSAKLFIDNQQILFYRVALNDTLYKSFDYSFPVQTETGDLAAGSVRFEFNVIDQEIITGTLYWNNHQGCSAEYKFDMALLYPSELPAYVPQQGFWSILYGGSIICGGTPINTTTLLVPFGTGSMHVSGGGPLPMILSFSGVSGAFGFVQQGSTNSYISMPQVYTPIGTGVDISNGSLININGMPQAWVLSETSITGILTGFCTPGNTFGIPFTMTFLE